MTKEFKEEFWVARGVKKRHKYERRSTDAEILTPEIERWNMDNKSIGDELWMTRRILKDEIWMTREDREDLRMTRGVKIRNMDNKRS